MSNRAAILTSLALLGSVAIFAATTPASALTMKECSSKYKIAQKNGSAKNVKWNDFRKAECGADATAEPDVSLDAEEEPEKATAAAPRGVMFPKAISAKYASETAGKGRLHTCVDAYHQNKAKKTNKRARHRGAPFSIAHESGQISNW
jgi:hypothetical protein